MSIRKRNSSCGAFVITLAVLLLASPALAQADGEAAAQTHSLMDFIRAGGIIGYLIIALSVFAVALVVDTILRTQREKLLPDGLVKHSLELAEHGRLGELLAMCKASDTMYGRLVGQALDRARHGIDAVRQEMQQLGEREVLRLRYRVGYIGVVATAAPMLGLLGTVIGMINSFSVLGAARNAARPDELAVGISVALVTTCMGLILAVPLIFVHAWLRDKVTAISQEAAHLGEKLLGLIAMSSANRARQAAQAPPQHVPQPAPPRPDVAMPPLGAGGVASANFGTGLRS
jgi:biopolymer transport protein ExbB